MKTMKRLLWIWLLAIALPLGAARADEPKKDEGWQSVSMPGMGNLRDESYSSTTLVTAAYGFIWLMVCGFVVTVWARGRKVEREIDELKSAIERRGAAKG